MRLQLCAFWFAYMAGLGIFFPFYGLYLRQDLGFSGTEVGLIVATIPLVGLFSQPLWGRLADRTGSRPLVLGVLSIGVALAHSWLGFLNDFSAVLLGTAGLALFSNALLPMATAVSLGTRQHRSVEAFGFIRLWGTVGFLVSVIVFPRLLPKLQEHLPAVWTGLAWMFPVTAGCALIAAVLAFRLPRAEMTVTRSAPGDTRRLLRHRPVLLLLVVVFLAHLSMQGPINLFPLFIAARGGDVDSIGQMWIFMLLLEIPLIGFSGRTLRSFGARGLLTIGLLAEGCRWLICALVTDLSWIRGVQLLHGVGVAGVLVGAPLYLEQCAPERLRATGQTLISTVGFGLGAILSVAGGGWLFDNFGAGTPFLVCGIGALVLGLLVHFILPHPYRPIEEGSDRVAPPAKAPLAKPRQEEDS